jgi:hypothetical protein
MTVEQNPLIVFIAGWSHAGKDAVAKILVESYDFSRFAIADAVKFRVASDQAIPIEWCFDQEKKSKPFRVDSDRTLREEIIRMAEEGRTKDKEIWAREISNDLKKAIRKGQRKFLISDWRHIEELLAIQKKIPEAILVPIQVIRPSQLVSPVPDLTEYRLLGFPFWHTILNNGSLIRLSTTVASFVEDELSKIWNI